MRRFGGEKMEPPDRKTGFVSLHETAGQGGKKPVTRINFTCMLSNIHELLAMVRLGVGPRRELLSLHVRHLLAYADEQNSYREQMAYLKVFNSVAEGSKGGS